MKNYIVIFVIGWLFACQNSKEVKKNVQQSGFITSPNCVCDSVSQNKIEEVIHSFVDSTHTQQMAKVFKIILGRRYHHTRANVFSVKYYDDSWEYDLPCSYKEYNGTLLLFYNGNENFVQLDTLYQQTLRSKLRTKAATLDTGKLYCGNRVLQIDFYKKDSILINLPSKNPMDFDYEPPTIYDFSPPEQKKK